MYLKTDESGFTLIELVVVIAILAVMSLIALPKISGFFGDERKESAIFESYIAAVTDDSYTGMHDNYLCISLKKPGGTVVEVLPDAYRENSLSVYQLSEQRFKHNEKKILKQRSFSDNFTFSQLILDGGMSVSEGFVLIPFYSDGSSEGFTLRITSDTGEIYLRKYRNVKTVQKVNSI